VGDTVVYSIVFSTPAGLRLNVTSLLLHRLREAAAASAQINQMFVGMYKFLGRTGVDEFYFVRGCQLVSKPACFRVHPLTRALLRACCPKQYTKLCGRLEPEPTLEPVATGQPGAISLPHESQV